MEDFEKAVQAYARALGVEIREDRLKARAQLLAGKIALWAEMDEAELRKLRGLK